MERVPDVAERTMHFEAHIDVDRSPEAVAAFFEVPENLARWDRSVARVVPTSTGGPADGITFDTVAPSGMRMSYRVTEHEPGRSWTIDLVSSPMFKAAIWGMRCDPTATGSRITCVVDFTLRPLYWLLAIPLLLTQRKALGRDLASLKQAIESDAYDVHTR
jgi:hypothetical protein